MTNNNSLRQEIKNILVTIWGNGRDDDWIDIPEYTDDILKLIEKRIDDIEIPIDYSDGESWGYEQGLNKVKEILK